MEEESRSGGNQGALIVAGECRRQVDPSVALGHDRPGAIAAQGRNPGLGKDAETKESSYDGCLEKCSRFRSSRSELG